MFLVKAVTNICRHFHWGKKISERVKGHIYYSLCWWGKKLGEDATKQIYYETNEFRSYFMEEPGSQVYPTNSDQTHFGIVVVCRVHVVGREIRKWTLESPRGVPIFMKALCSSWSWWWWWWHREKKNHAVFICDCIPSLCIIDIWYNGLMKTT